MKKAKILIILGIAICLCTAVYLLVFTTQGSKIAFDKMISKYAEHDGLDYAKIEGSLADGLLFQNLEIRNLRNLPAGATLKAQRIFLKLNSLNANGIYAELENVRLKLPDSDPVIVSGTLKNQQLDVNIYSKGFTVTEVLSYLPDFKALIPIKGNVDDIDLFIAGSIHEPIVKGDFTIEKFVYKGFMLTNAPIKLDMQLKDIYSDIKLHGSVNMEKGELQTKRILVKLDKGGLNFSGAWNEPWINIKGRSKVEKTKISIGLTGTIAKPELSLESEPPYARQRLMVMLATGKSWKSLEESADGGFNSAALTKDFIDYFFFAGKSNKFAEKFGISDFSVTYDENIRGVSAKKDISEKLEVGYGIEQAKENGQIADVSQKLGGEYKLNDRVSVGVEREMKKKQANDLLDEQLNENNDKVMMKYKKSF